MRLKKQTNAVYLCEYHLVFPTKYRHKIFNAGVFAYLEEILKKIPDYYPEIEIIKINHDEDHIHILVSIPPKYSVGKVVGIIKANTARMLRKMRPRLKNILRNKVKRILGKRSLKCVARNRLRKLPVIHHGKGSLIYAKPAENNCADVGGESFYR